MHIRVFTAFSGYDSQCLALDRLSRDYPDFSYELVGWSEIDKYAIMAHNALYPEASHLNFGDISKIDWGGQIPDFDLFTYSFPCQDISSAGLQRGFTEGGGTRSGLLWECKKAIEAKRPRYLLMENVKALIQKKHLPDFHKWISWLDEQGYMNFWQVLNAKDYGVPQSRERVFMVSILDPNARYEFPKPFTLERRLKDVLEPLVDESYYLKQEQVERIIEHCERKQAEGCGFKTNFIDPQEASGGGYCNTLTTLYGGRPTDPFLKIKEASNGEAMNDERTTKRINRRLGDMLADGRIDPAKTQYVDEYNMATTEDVTGAISTRIDQANHYFVNEGNSTPPPDGTTMLRYPHGYYQGGVMRTDVTPSITTSHFEANNFIVDEK